MIDAGLAPMQRPEAASRRRIKLALSFAAAALLTLLSQLVRLPLPDPAWSIDTPCEVGAAGAEGTSDAAGAAGCALPRDDDHAARLLTYHYTAPQGRAGTGPWTIYVANSSAELEVLLNGLVIQRWSNPGAEMVLFRSVQTLVVAPDTLLSGTNRIDIRIKQWGRFPAVVNRVYFGPDAQLRPIYQSRWIADVLLGQLGAVWRLLLAAFLLILWYNRPQERAYGIFAATVLSGLIPALQQITPALSFFGPTLRLGNFALLWQAVLLVPFTFHYCGRRPPGGTSVYFWALVVMTAGFFLLPIDLTFVVARIIVMPVMVISLVTTLVVLSRAAMRDDKASIYLTVTGVALTICLAAVDPAAVFRFISAPPAYAARYALLLLFAVFSATLCSRFAASLNAVDNFNRELQARLEAAQRKLAESLRREHEQEQEAALHHERDRLVRDLHDGVSGRMLSVIATCEMRDDEYADLAQQVRLALGELRLVIASLVDVGGDLAQLIANFAEQAGGQLRQMGVRLHVKTADLPPVEGLRPTHALHIFRILQQAAMNAAVHSGSADLHLTVTAPDDGSHGGVRIELADQGNGQVNEKRGGFGMNSMRQRAATLNAALHIAGSAEGTRVVLHLPERMPEL